MGFELRRLRPVDSTGQSRENYSEVLIAGYLMKVNNINPICNWYQKHPQYNSQLGRLAEVIQKKYSNLGIIDVGANIGDTLAIIKSKTDADYICIEGDPTVIQYLQLNAQQFRNVKIIKSFLGDRVESAKFKIEKQGWNTTLIPNEEGQSSELEILTLDHVSNMINKIDNFKLLKIDTEGYDTKIIRGGWSYIENVKPIIYIEYNRKNMDRINENGIEIFEKLNSLGYLDLLIFESQGRFVLSTNLNEKKLITQLDNYIRGKNSIIPYFDLAIFHKNDIDIANKFVSIEEDIQ